MSLSGWRGVAVVSLFAMAPGMAAAADLPAQAPPPPTAPATYALPAPDWIVTVGVEPRAIPAWPGAADSRLGWSVLPLFNIRRAGTPPEFFGALDSFGFPIFKNPQFEFGPAFKLIWQRQSSSYAELNGLPDVDFAFQVGAYADFWPVPWLRLRGEVRQGFGGETGVTGDLFLDVVVPAGPWRFSAGPRMVVQSASAVSPYFSITAAQATAANQLQPTSWAS